MYEILEAALPFFEITSNKTLVSEICKGLKLGRPTKVETPDSIFNLMTKCCSTDPSERPDFQQIFERIKEILTEVQGVQPQEIEEPLGQGEASMGYTSLHDAYSMSPTMS